jgi:hypothetical protein
MGPFPFEPVARLVTVAVHQAQDVQDMDEQGDE